MFLAKHDRPRDFCWFLLRVSCVWMQQSSTAYYNDLWRTLHGSNEEDPSEVDQQPVWENSWREKYGAWCVDYPSPLLNYAVHQWWAPSAGYDALKIDCVLFKWKHNVDFYQSQFPDDPSDLQSHLILGIEALCRIHFREELYSDHGTIVLSILFVAIKRKLEFRFWGLFDWYYCIDVNVVRQF